MSFSLPVKITVGSVPGSYQPPNDMQGLLEAIPQFTTYEMHDTGASVNISANGAGANGNGLWVWMLNAYKLPPRILTGYRNDWWTVYNGIPGEIRMLIASRSSYFDASGRGLHWGLWEGWALCNGQNGTVHLANDFLVPGYRWDSGAGWVTNVNTYSTFNGASMATDWWTQNNFDSWGGGSRAFNITLVNFGNYYDEAGAATLNLNYSSFYSSLKHGGSGGGWMVNEPGIHGGGYNYATWVYPLDQSPYMVNSPISRIPPYIAVGYAQFVGYL